MSKICRHCQNFTPSPNDDKIGKCWSATSMSLPCDDDELPANTPCDTCPGFKPFPGGTGKWGLSLLRQISVQEIDELIEDTRRKRNRALDAMLIASLILLVAMFAKTSFLPLDAVSHTSIWG